MEAILGEWLQIVAMVGLLACSALFAGSETAFFSLTRAQVRRFRRDGGLLSVLAARLMEQPRPLLISVLLGNLAVNVAFFSVGVELSLVAARAGHEVAAVGVSGAAVLAVIFFGEFLPKGFALARPSWTARHVAPPVYLFAQAILPFRLALDLVVKATSVLLGGRYLSNPNVTAEELKAFVRLSGSAGRLQDGEREMLEDVIDLGEIRVKEVMVPRVDMVAVDVAAGGEDLLSLVREKRVSKVVVYEGSRDRVMGYVAVKDLLYRPDADLAELVRPIPAVPETKSAESLLKELRVSGAALVLVVDEYGGTEGIVTPEDVLEEVVGEILDEYDEEKGPIRRVAPGVYLVAGELSLRDWEERTGFSLPAGKYDTVGGFVVATLDRIPQPGETVRIPGMRFTVLRVRRGRILSLIADRIAEAES